MNVPPTFARAASEGSNSHRARMEVLVGRYAQRYRPAQSSLRVLAAGGTASAEAYLDLRALVVLAESAPFDRRAHAHRRVSPSGLPTPHRTGEADVVLLPGLDTRDPATVASAVAQALAAGGVCVTATETDGLEGISRAFEGVGLELIEEASVGEGVSVLVAKDPRPEFPSPAGLIDLDRSTCIDRQRVLDAFINEPWLGPRPSSSADVNDLLKAVEAQLRTGEPDPTTLPWPTPRAPEPRGPALLCDLLAVMPHPDDESIYLGGTLAGLSAAGQRVRLLTVTDGAGGRGGEGLSVRRRRELAAAAEVLGVEEVRVLGWEDFGKYRDDARTQAVTGADALRVWGLDSSLVELVAEIRRVRPRRVLGLHPCVDPNLSLHGHHLGLGLLLALAFHAAADPAFAPECGRVWRVEEHRVVMPPCHAAWADPFDVDRGVKSKALEAHQSQRYSTTRLIESLADPKRSAVEYTRVLQGKAERPWVLMRRSPAASVDQGVDWKPVAETVNAYPRPRAALVDVLRRQAGPERSPAEDESLACLLDEDGVAVLTGQQVGLLGGPVYTLAKALSAVALARRLAHEGIRAAPVFWLASQDHDLAEVQQVARLGGSTLELGLVDDGAPVGRRRLGPQVEKLWERFVAELPPGSDPEVLEELRGAMSSEHSFGASFKKVLRWATRDTGLLLLDPDDPDFAALAAPLFRRTMDENDALQAALEQSRTRLAASGAKEVVSTRREVSQLFFVGTDGRRRRLEHDELTSPRIRAALTDDAQRFSGAALLRPLVQDFVLPTIAIVAGPTEARYLDQTRELYSWAGIPRPRVLRRASFFPVATRDARVLLPTGEVASLRASSNALADLGYAALPPAAASWFDAIESLIAALDEVGAEMPGAAVEAALRPSPEALAELPRLSHSWPRWARVLADRSEAISDESRSQASRRARGRLRGELLRLRRSLLRDGRKLARPALEAWRRVGGSPERRMSVVELLARGGSELPRQLLAALENELSPEIEIWLGGDR